MLSDQNIDDFLLRYPAIRLETLPNYKYYFTGNVRLQNTWYHLEIHCPKFPQLRDMKLRLQQALRVGDFDATTAGAQPHWTIDDLISHFPKLIPPVTPTATLTPTSSATTLETTSNLYAEIAKLKSNAYRIDINENCSRIRFSKFQQFEQHFLELTLPNLQLLEHSLPDCIPCSELLGKCATLTSLLQQFLKYLEELRGFYEQFADIDEMCYVVQPLPVSSKDNWRLFLLRERVFLKLLIADPFAPEASMSLHIIGPTYEVEQLRRCYSEGLKHWDSELDIHKNLLRIFDLCFFPMPPGSEALGVQQLEAPQHCNICYCHQLDGEVPIVSCDNRNCQLIFHAACLREWFNTLSDGKVFLEVSFGTCPFCKAKLSTSFEELFTNEKMRV